MAKPIIPVARSKSEDGSGAAVAVTAPVPPLKGVAKVGVHPGSPQVPSKALNPIVPPEFVKALANNRSNTGEPVGVDEEFGTKDISVADGPKPGFTLR
jgi:hypothetical protein